MKKAKTIFVWILAFIITIAAAVFQRMTGPTHPFKESVTFNEKKWDFKLPRSLDTGGNSIIAIDIQDAGVTGIVAYRPYPSNHAFTTDTLKHAGSGMEFTLPEQKAAGKVEYKITLADRYTTYESPVLLVRYKDPVPAIWLIPHILFMFIAMFFSVAAGIMAVSNYGNYSRTVLWAGILLFLGGLIFGPIVQKYAFGDFWTGVPFGWDLTDNKTLIAMIFFVIAILVNRRKPSRLWTIVAVLVLLVIYSIPHSLYGSELDHETGKVVQGSIGALVACLKVKANFLNRQEGSLNSYTHDI